MGNQAEELLRLRAHHAALAHELDEIRTALGAPSGPDGEWDLVAVAKKLKARVAELEDCELVAWADRADVSIHGVNLVWCRHANAYRFTTLMANEPEDFRAAHRGNVRYRYLGRVKRHDVWHPTLTPEAREIIRAAMRDAPK
jgi:hypothetical protein